MVIPGGDLYGQQTGLRMRCFNSAHDDGLAPLTSGLGRPPSLWETKFQEKFGHKRVIQHYQNRSSLYLYLPSACEGMRQGAAVYVFQFAAQGYAVGDAGDFDAARVHQFADVMCGGFALHGGVGGEDDFAYH